MNQGVQDVTTAAAGRGRPWRDWFARQLELPPGAGAGQFLKALFVRPAGPVRAPRVSMSSGGVATGVASLLEWAWKLLLYPLLRLLWWPIEFLTALAERIARRLRGIGIGAQTAERVQPWLLRFPGAEWLMLALGTVALAVVITAPLNWAGQLIFLLGLWFLALVVRGMPGRFPSMVLAAMSFVAMGRYAWWRLHNTLEFESALEAFLGYGLLLAESYTWLIVVLGFIQTAWPLKREVAPLQGDPSTWPSVDVFITTYNEPLEVVRASALAAKMLDWPADKLKVYILDDGRRDEFRDFAAEIGVNYLRRSDNKGAKAGNLNHALGQTDGELVAIFDCDHIPVRTFLTKTVGWLQREPRCALVQTPHHFFSADPFERNLDTFRKVPNEGALFYGIVQDGNDFWNATFFCGSCAVMRRDALLAVGGVATETVTEDAHTALRLHRAGYTTAYLNETQAAGLATESLSAHIGQRIRWARGMAQIFRVDNPLLGRGLSLWQRFCYANAMLHFFFSLPRLVFLTAPMAYLFFHLHIIHASAVMIVLYVLPYLLQTTIANAHIQGKYRHTFWGEVYETALAYYLALPTTMALIAPKVGKFNVTAKGGLVDQSYFDWGISRPYSILAVLSLAAFVMGLWRLFVINTDETATVLLNMFWISYNIVVLGACLGVAAESKQVRRMHRVAARVPATVHLPSGDSRLVACTDFSLSGLGLKVPATLTLTPGTVLQVGLQRHGEEHRFPARVVVARPDGGVGLEFEPLSNEQQENLVQCTFARPEAWADWSRDPDTDRVTQGFKEVFSNGLSGYAGLWRFLRADLARLRGARAPAAKELA